MQEILQLAFAIARGMWKFRWPALVTAWAVAVLGTVVVWRIPDVYEASARVYVDTDSILKPLMAGLTVQPNVQQQIQMLTRTLLSRPNMEKLVRMADLDLKSQSRADQEALILELQKGISMQAAGGANLYTMTYRDNEPEKAKRVVQALVSMFVESGLGASRKDADSARTFLSEQIKAYEAKLEEAEARVKEFRIRNIELQSPDGKDVPTRLAEINQQLEQAKAQLREAENGRDAAKAQIDAMGKGQLPGMAPAAPLAEAAIPVSTPEIDARIDAAQRSIDTLTQRYTDQHPDVVQARRLLRELEEQKKREVAELRKQAAAAAASSPVAAAPGSVNAMVAQELQRMLATAEMQVSAVRARVADLTQRMAQARAGLRDAPEREAEAAQLNRDYGAIKSTYDNLVSRRQTAVMSGELEVASGVAEFRLIDPPRVTPKPVAPNRLALFPMVLAASLAAGLGLAFAGSQLRPTFGDAAELRAKTGLPLLGVVTALVSERDLRRQRANLFRWVSASGGLVGLFVAGMIAMVVMNRYGA